MPRNTAQQLYDVGYMVYRGEREVEEGEEGRKKDRREGRNEKRGMPNKKRRKERESGRWRFV